MRLCSIVYVRIQRAATARFVFAFILAYLPHGEQYGGLFDGYPDPVIRGNNTENKLSIKDVTEI